jgi:hypothetical protein
MIQNVRSKVASKISKIKEADDFNFSNWLKKPAQHHHPIEPITSYLANLEAVQIEFVQPEFYEYKFDMIEPGVTDELKDCNFPKVRSNAIFFMIALPEEKGVVYSDVELKPKSFSSKKVRFLLNNPAIKKVKINFDTKPPQDIDCQIALPTTFNYLSNLVPEVFKIDLLDFEDLVSSSKKVKVQNIGLDKFKKTKIEKLNLPIIPEPKKIYRIKVPSIGSFKISEQKIALASFSQPTISDSLGFSLQRVKSWYANFNISKPGLFLYYRCAGVKGTSGTKQKAEESDVPSYLREQLGFILSNLRKVDWEKSGKYITKLKPYEEASAKFLVENNFALLQDEFGIDIQKEAIAALKLLFANRVVQSALIITDDTSLGNPKFAKHLNIEIGWSDKIKKYCPELALNIIQGNNDERADLWNKAKSIVIADIDTALDDYRLKILEDKSLYKFDCIILDSVDKIVLKKEVREEFLSAIHPKILWATSNILDRNLYQELNSLLNSSVKIEKLQLRSKQTMAESLPKILFNEFWCDTDEYQLAEFKTALVECKKDLRRVLESGNPLRFYANIFTLYHKLNQIANFASGKSKSPKSDLLLRQLSMIKENGKKVIVLSQYEKLGIKKIAELLNNHGIKHILAPKSLSAEDMQKATTMFQSQTDIVAFISDAKISNLKFSDFNLPYVIKFDQWWNPISNWEIEDIFVNKEESLQKESINLCNYYSSGILDERIREILLETDLLNKNIFELMQPKLYEDLILVDEWLRVFGMPVSTESKNEQTPEAVQSVLKKITIDAFRIILSRLFTVLGFSEVDILELPNSNSFNIVGASQRNNRNFSLNARVFIESKIDKKTIENILSETSKSQQDKVFIITRESFPEISIDKLRENVTMLDGLALSKLLIRVGILPTPVLV